MEHGHIHISTPFLFMLAFAVIALIAVILMSKNSKRESLRRLEADRMDYALRSKALDKGGVYTQKPTYTPPPVPRTRYVADDQGAGVRVPYTAPAAPVYAPNPTVIHTNNTGGSDMLMGVLIGEAIAGGGHHDSYRETVVHDYSAPSAPSDSGASASWGSDSSGSDLSSSSSDSGGGFDVSW